MYTGHLDGRLLRRPFHYGSEQRRVPHQFPLQDIEQIVPFGHNIVNEHAFPACFGEHPLEPCKSGAVDHQRFICEYIQSGPDRSFDIIDLAAVVTGQQNDVTALLGQHLFKVICPDIGLLLPVSRIFLPSVERFDQIEITLHFIASRRIHPDRAVDTRIRIFLHQSGMEMARIETDQAHLAVGSRERGGQMRCAASHDRCGQK